MFTTGLIVFRETLEAALFIGIMAAATRGLMGRSWAIVIGVLAGLAGAFAIAALTERINDAANGTGQEWLNVMVLGLAFVMLTWHVMWSSRHGKELAGQAKTLGANAKSGKSSMWAISIAIAMIVLREGAETVLFVTGALASNDTPPAVVQAAQTHVIQPSAAQGLVQEIDLTKPTSSAAMALPQELDLTKKASPAQAVPLSALPQTVDLTQAPTPSAAPAHSISSAALSEPAQGDSTSGDSVEPMTARDVVSGGFAGLGLGAIVGLVMYFGLVRVPVGRMFSITNAFVVVLAAGMMGQIGNKLVQAQVLPSGADPLWDSSRLIGADSAAGTFFHALMGYEAQPSLTHVAFFAAGLFMIVMVARWAKTRV
ncbi:hypothetical protein DTO96_100685 [Ephemeroptericola cinctiostellae]|uniref:Ferrous iron permease EfeU n=1 Tax=Ephemeroptericola cinctiostellae TaxID=2268024 RepID=A0A345D9D0_9BURK|nr:FTR1 family protein [Ephemeroptericola cinctiostellae]AXF84968.1 hypothetical protein DTO96_100685 [Ephemeroptericola cinctiostellae]